MSRSNKTIHDKFVAKTKSEPYDLYDRENTPERYDLNHATPSRLSSSDD